MNNLNWKNITSTAYKTRNLSNSICYLVCARCKCMFICTCDSFEFTPRCMHVCASQYVCDVVKGTM